MLEQLSIALLAICSLGLVFHDCSAQDQGEESLQDARTEKTISTLKWRSEEPSRSLEVLQLLLGDTKGNYQKMRTWQGTYAVHSEEWLTREYVADISNDAFKEPLVKELEYLMSFVIDVEADSIWRSRANVTTTFKREELGEVVDIPNIRSCEGRDIVTPEHCITYDPKSIWGGFPELPDHPELHGIRAAIREVPDRVDKMHFGDLIEPRNFFGIGNATQKSWNVLQTAIDAFEGKHGEEGSKWVKENMTIDQASGPGGVWFRIVMLYDDATTRATAIWSPQAGHNLVKYDIVKTGGNKKQLPQTDISTDWKQIDGVFVPNRVTESMYRPDSGEQYLFRELAIRQCSVNQPIEPSQFSYAALGMEEGCVIKDTIEKAVFFIKDGQPKKFANFGEKYIPALGSGLAASGTGFSIARRVSIVITILFVIVLSVLVIRKRAGTGAL